MLYNCQMVRSVLLITATIIIIITATIIIIIITATTIINAL